MSDPQVPLSAEMARAHADMWLEMKARAQSAEAALAALREGMEGLARELASDGRRKPATIWGRGQVHAWADAAARIRAVLEGQDHG